LAVDTFSLRARVPDGKIVDGLTALTVEAKRVRDFGFTAAELERAKKGMLAGYERAYNERDKSESGGYAQEYLSYFLEEEPTPGIEYEYRLAQQVLAGVTLDEVNGLARKALADDSRVVLAVSPQKPSITVPSEGDLRGAIDSGEKVAVTPWTDATLAGALMEQKPAAGTVVNRRTLPEV